MALPTKPYEVYIPTGNRTFLHNVKTIARNLSRISVPKKRKSRAGVTKIPAKLLRTALHMDVATFPPDYVQKDEGSGI